MGQPWIAFGLIVLLSPGSWQAGIIMRRSGFKEVFRRGFANLIYIPEVVTLDGHQKQVTNSCTKYVLTALLFAQPFSLLFFIILTRLLVPQGMRTKEYEEYNEYLILQ